jgi:succinate dehydrogenase / fumarate reductase flavoprotein subunit
MALDLIRDESGDVVGVTALEMETGDLYILQAKTVLLATGGAGRIFAASTNAFINTGDGLGMAARAGIRCKTWSSGSSTPPAWPVPACC